MKALWLTIWGILSDFDFWLLIAVSVIVGLVANHFFGG